MMKRLTSEDNKVAEVAATETVAQENLPIWMEKTLRGTDWGILIVLALSLLAAWPFLLQSGLPRTNASENYVYRTADTVQALGEGRLYPRWSPNAINGYGAPIPQYYPPGAAYLPALLDVLLTNNATLAVKLIYSAAFLLAGGSVYAFVTRRSNARAGVVAALLYVYSPYLDLVAPHLLGDLPGMIGLALLPALLWSIDRLLQINRPFDLLYVALISAGLLLTDVHIAMAGWLLAAALVAFSRQRFPRWYLALAAGLLSVGLAAFYWLPALAEADAVQWYVRPDALAGTLTLGGLLAPLLPLDPGALLPLRQFTLGLAAPLLALASIVPVMRRRLSFHALFLAAGLVFIVLGLAVLPSATELVGVIALCLAIGASAVVTWNRKALLPAVTAGLILVAAAPGWLAPRWSAEPLDTSASAQLDYEQQGFGIAALPNGKALPSSIAPDSTPNRNLIASTHAGVMNKAESAVGAQVGVLAHNTHSDQFQAQTMAALTLHILTAYFPGWSARLNEDSIPLRRSTDGLIDVDLPGPVRGELQVTLGATPPRTFGWMIAWAALIVLGGLTLARSRRAARAVRMSHSPVLELLPKADALLLALLGVSFAAAVAATAIPGAPLRAQTEARPNYLLAGSATLDNRSDTGLELMAYRVEQQNYRRGDDIDLTLYWHTLRFLTENYAERLSLLDLQTGEYREPSDLRVPGGYPTRRWLPGYYIPDRYTFVLPPEFPAGDFSPALEVCLAAPDGCAQSGGPLTFFTGASTTYGPVLVLPIILNIQ